MIGEILLVANLLAGAVGCGFLWRTAVAADFRYRMPAPEVNSAILSTVDTDYKGLV